MKKILHLTLFLAIISSIAGGALAFVNSITEPIITANALKEVQATLEEFFPNGEFEEVSVLGEPATITNIYEVKDEGVVYKVSSQGFKDKLIYLVAIDSDNNFVGYKVTQNNDTQGFGTRVSEAEFTDQFLDQSIDTEIDTLSGASVSSTAIIVGLDEVVEYHKTNY